MNTFLSTLPAVPINSYIALSAVLFCIGALGVMIRRNIIIMLMCIELMLNSVNLLLTAFSSFKNDADGQVFVFFVMAVAAAEVAVGLGIIVMIYRNTFSIDIDRLSELKN
ncbi:MAG: NADH-quinone oxidoreductase subunit NuoK [Bacteroidia bacterium]|nr:NADH-quinone oxidoreductase subunit NuoK [Bacteroidia bacterium]